MSFIIRNLNLQKKITNVIRLQKYSTNSEDILAGLKVLDMTRILAGPFCTMILSDMGAEVIKVEKPGTGDETRKWGPPFVNDSSESCYFISINRNKKSICVNLKTDEGRQIIYNLAKISDVFVENYVPGTLDKLKLGYEDLKAIAPHLIYCSISGYGSEGPYKNKPGYDVIAASMGGLLNITGPKTGDPVKVGVAVTDLATGLYAHGAILAALLRKNRTGKGQKIDCNLLSTQIASLVNISSNYLNKGKEAQRWGSEHESLVPYQMFKTKDGFLTIGAGSDAQFKDLCKKIGKEELGNDPNYQTNALRVTNRVKLIKIIEETIKLKTNEEWTEIFDNSSFPNSPVNTLKEVFNNIHVKSIGLVKTIEHPKTGSMKLVGPPVKYSDGCNKIRSAPPLLGEHTEEILKQHLGYSDNKIMELKKKGVID